MKPMTLEEFDRTVGIARADPTVERRIREALRQREQLLVEREEIREEVAEAREGLEEIERKLFGEAEEGEDVTGMKGMIGPICIPCLFKREEEEAGGKYMVAPEKRDCIMCEGRGK